MKISTSILSCEDRVKAVLELNRTNTSYIHVDVMDGKFVSDVQFDSIKKIHSVNLVSKKLLDIHLMVDNPLEYIKQLSDFNIEYITFHVEVNKNIDKIIKSIHDMGYKAGLAICPKTDVKILEKYLDSIDLILVMCVNPGKGGQKFINSSLDKIKKVKELIGGRDILIEVDGGINDSTIDMVKDVDIAVVGSYIVKSDNYYKAVESLIVKEEEVNKEVNEEKNLFKTLFAVLKVIAIIYMFFLLLFAFRSSVSGIGGCFGTCARDYGISAFIFVIFFGIMIFPILVAAAFFWLFLPAFAIYKLVNFIRKKN